MPDYVTNRLHFLSNDKTILAHLKSRHPENKCPAQFSLNSIKKTPGELKLPLDPILLELAQSNMQMPSLDPKTEQMVFEHVLKGHTGHSDVSGIHQKIKEIRSFMLQSPTTTDTSAASFEQAVANYEQFKFFCHYDWRMHNWGTVEDIHTVVATTFEPPTRLIEFETAWSPPIAAVQLLSNAFPSVRFRLEYCFRPDPWVEVEFFPFPPFGY
jgi:hypothetical protein